MDKKSIIQFFFIAISFVLITTGCNKDRPRMEVIKDCTGVYLRAKNGQDFKVCNEELLDNISAGTKIKVSYDNLAECFGLIEPVTCTVTHVYEGTIEITEIF